MVILQSGDWNRTSRGYTLLVLRKEYAGHIRVLSRHFKTQEPWAEKLK